MDEYLHSALEACSRRELSSIFDGSDNVLSSIDSLREERPDDIVVKLLWCHVHAEHGDLPLPILASNVLESISQASTECPRLLFFVTSALVHKMKGEARISVMLMKEFFFNFKAEYFRSKEHWSAKLSDFTSLLEKEIDDARARKEDRSYIAEVRRLHDESTSLAWPKGVNPTEDAFSDKATVKRDRKKTEREDVSWQFGAPTNEKETREGKEEAQIEEASKHSSILKMMAICAVLLLLVFSVFKVSPVVQSYFFDYEEYEPIYSSLDSSMLEKPLVPNLPVAVISKQSSSLHRIRERIDNIGSGVRDIKEKLEEKKEEIPPSPEPEEDDYEVESLNVIPDKSAKPVPKLPPRRDIDPVDLGHVKRQALKGRSPYPSTIKKNADGRTYGPPRVVDPALGRGRERALDGSPLKSYEVRRFDPPLNYKTLTATNVLSAPSLLAPKLSRLKSGTPVQVTSKLGLWLEIQSQKGRYGYIYAQDALEDK